MSGQDPIKNDLSTLFFRNRYLLTLSLVVILIAGLSALLSLPRLEDPRIANRNPLILTMVPGASAERVETQVTEILEEALQEIAAIKTLESTSRAGISILTLELDPKINDATNQEVFAEIRSKIDDVAPFLPTEARTPLLDDKRTPVAFTLILALRWENDDEPRLGILNRLVEDLADRLRAVPGTELVRLYGTAEEEILVTADPADWAELGLNAESVARLMAQSDAKGAAGVLRSERSNVLLEVEGELDSLERIASLPIAGDASSGLVRLGEIATVERQIRSPVDDIALIDGDRSVLLAIRMDADQRVDVWAEAIEQQITAFSSPLGSGVSIDPIFEQARYTSRQLTDLGSNLIAGAAVVVLVVLLMMGWRLALIVGFALPLVVSIVLFSWQVSDGALQQMSIFGLIIALGLLIDNAIVMADEVQHRRDKGDSALAAVRGAVGHLFLPLLASTLTTILAFAPIMLLTGGVGDFVRSIGSSVITAVVASFFVAMTLTAALAGLFARPAPRGTNPKRLGWRRIWRHGLASERLTTLYRRGLNFSLKQPVVALMIALFLPLSGFLAARSLGNEFFPPVDRNMFHIQMWLPTDSSIERTTSQVRAAEQVIREFTANERVFWFVGGNFPTVYYNLVMRQDNASHFAQAIVTTSSSDQVKDTIEDLQSALDERFPEAQWVVRQFGQGPPIFADVELRLYGPTLRGMQEVGEQIRLALQAHPDVLHTRVSLPRGEPKLWLQADEDEARLIGLDLTTIAGQLQANLEGSMGGTMIENLEQMPVRVRYRDQQRGDLSHIASLPLVLEGQIDWAVLPTLGELELRPEIGGISRYDGQRMNSIQAFTRNDALPIEVARVVLARLEGGDLSLPPGYRLEIGGAIEEDAEAKGNLTTYAPILLTLMIATLILAFRSVSLALLLGAVAALSVGLGLLATSLAGFPVSFNTILGTLGLIGVALNDSIVVLAAIRSDPRAAQGHVSAIVEQVIGSTRHVLSTTLTTIGGFLPLLLFVGGDFWPSLAVVLVGGIVGASLLALLLIPGAYILIHRPKRSGRATKRTPINDDLDLLPANPVLSGGA